jgi:HEPN domain-containing protein
LLIHRGASFPKSHDLTELAQLLPASDRGAIPLAGLPELNPYAVETRYPGAWDEVTVAEASRAVDLARRVRAAVRTLLSPAPEPGQPVTPQA